MDQKALIILISILVLIVLLSIVKVVFSIIWWIIVPISLIGAGIIVLFTFLFHKDKKSEGYSTKRKLNIYGEPLQVCQPGEYYRESSAMEDGTCSEEGGGVHQICVKSIGKGDSFSKKTGQSDWSKSRGDKNHCACLGAWANYVAKEGNKNLKCESIPETALDPKYIKKWAKWNDVTVPNQIKMGLESLKQQCLEKAPTKKGKEYLQTKYNEILKTITI